MPTTKKEKVKQYEELLKDVSSFANTEGGDLIIGMTEDGGIPKEVCGFETKDPDGYKSCGFPSSSRAMAGAENRRRHACSKYWR